MRFEELMTPEGMSTYQRIVMRSWSDAEFKSALDDEPKQALAEFGVSVEDHIAIKTVNNTPNTYHFVVPAKPDGDELSDDDLEAAAGGIVP